MCFSAAVDSPLCPKKVSWTKVEWSGPSPDWPATVGSLLRPFPPGLADQTGSSLSQSSQQPLAVLLQSPLAVPSVQTRWKVVRLTVLVTLVTPQHQTTNGLHFWGAAPDPVSRETVRTILATLRRTSVTLRVPCYSTMQILNVSSSTSKRSPQALHSEHACTDLAHRTSSVRKTKLPTTRSRPRPIHTDLREPVHERPPAQL